jgi:hypothetical protein
MRNEIWKLHYRLIRCHTESAPLKTRLLKMKDADLANTYFFHERVFGWDIDLPVSSTKQAENALGVKCDNSTSCPEVMLYEMRVEGAKIKAESPCDTSRIEDNNL